MKRVLIGEEERVGGEVREVQAVIVFVVGRDIISVRKVRCWWEEVIREEVIREECDVII